jgi:preprotein translocase subunit SecD
MHIRLRTPQALEAAQREAGELQSLLRYGIMPIAMDLVRIY